MPSRGASELSDEEFETTLAEWESSRSGYQAISAPTPHEIDRARRLATQNGPKTPISAARFREDVALIERETRPVRGPNAVRNITRRPAAENNATYSSAASSAGHIRRDLRAASHEVAGTTAEDRKKARAQARIAQGRLRTQRAAEFSSPSVPQQPLRRSLNDESIRALEAKLIREGKIKAPEL